MPITFLRDKNNKSLEIIPRRFYDNNYNPVDSDNLLLKDGSNVETVSDYTDVSADDMVLSNNKKFTLGAILAWIISKFATMTVVFGSLKTKTGVHGAEVEVADKYFCAQNFYDKEYIDDLEQSISDSKGSVLQVKNGNLEFGFLGEIISVIPTTYSSATSKTVGSWTSTSVPAAYRLPGRVYLFVNNNSVTLTMTGFADGSNYAIPAGRCLLYFYDGTNYYRMSDKT